MIPPRKSILNLINRKQTDICSKFDHYYIEEKNHFQWVSFVNIFDMVFKKLALTGKPTIVDLFWKSEKIRKQLEDCTKKNVISKSIGNIHGKTRFGTDRLK